MFTKNTPERGRIRVEVVLCALAAAMLWGCAPDAAEQPKTPELQRVIVKFRLPEKAGKNAVREEAARILSRLESKVRKTARTFELLPLIAVEADAKTLMQLVRMPEVESVQPDRKVKLFGSPVMTAPVAPPGTTRR